MSVCIMSGLSFEFFFSIQSLFPIVRAFQEEKVRSFEDAHVKHIPY